MQWLLLLLGLGLLVWAGAKWLAGADSGTVAKTLKWIAIAVGAVLVLYLMLTRNWAYAMAVAGPALLLWRRMRGLTFPFTMPGRSQPRGSQGSGVETAYLRMTLDHDSGEMSGTVLQGTFAGRSLESMSLDELLTLYTECHAADESALRLLEAYLDRGPHADEWREKLETRRAKAVSPGAGAMTREEACMVLGVSPDASPEEIKAAHRRLMTKIHPDRGGSSYLAAKINLAKEVLLGT